MLAQPRPLRSLAIALAALAGFVDSVAFLQLKGFFVSFMSGNSTRLGVGLAGALPEAGFAACLIVSFVSGVALGSIAARRAGRLQRPAVLTMVGILLAAAAIVGDRAIPFGASLAFALGCMNAAFEQAGGPRLGLTYMTGALVKVGEEIATTLSGGRRGGWMPYLLLWGGFVGGATAGAVVWPLFGVTLVWIAALAAVGLALVAWRLDRA